MRRESFLRVGASRGNSTQARHVAGTRRASLPCTGVRRPALGEDPNSSMPEQHPSRTSSHASWHARRAESLIAAPAMFGVMYVTIRKCPGHASKAEGAGPQHAGTRAPRALEPSNASYIAADVSKRAASAGKRTNGFIFYDAWEMAISDVAQREYALRCIPPRDTGDHFMSTNTVGRVKNRVSDSIIGFSS